MEAQEPRWLFAPSLGIDMGGAIPVPFSAMPEDAKGTPRLMPTLGVGAQYRLSGKWRLGAEMNYHILGIDGYVNVVSQAFWSDDRSYATYFTGEAYSSTELRFIEFPLNVYYHLNDNWSIVFGGYYSVILKARMETEGKNGWLSTNKEDTDTAPLPGTQNTFYAFNDDLDNYDLGGLLGFQYKISQKMIFWGRFNLGFKSIFRPEFNNIDYDMYQMRFSTGVSFVIWTRE
jgi:hypothetical protein